MLSPVDPVPLLLVAAAVGTSLLSGVFGMAGGMLLMGILLAVLPVPDAMALHGVCQATSNGIRAWLLRAHVDRMVVGRYLAGALPAAAAAAWMGPVLPRRVVFLLLGGIPLGALLLSRRGLPAVERRGVAETCGATVITAQFAAGASGPLLDLFYLRSAADRRTVVGTKALTQTVGHVLKAAVFATAGAGAAGAAALPRWLLPAMLGGVLLGTGAGRHLLDRLPEASFRAWTRRLVLALSLGAVARGLAE